MFHRFAIFCTVQLNNNKWFIIILYKSIYFVIRFFFVHTFFSFRFFIIHDVTVYDVFFWFTELYYFIQFDSLGNILQSLPIKKQNLIQRNPGILDVI